MNNDNQEITKQLLTKIRMLIAVLEVAILKLSNAMDGEGVNKQKLSQIKNNLQNTLRICFNARNILEKKMGIVRELEDVADFSPEEDTKIIPTNRPAITMNDIEATDLHELCRKLGNL